jgi:hypothetical protein
MLNLVVAQGFGVSAVRVGASRGATPQRLIGRNHSETGGDYLIIGSND